MGKTIGSSSQLALYFFFLFFLSNIFFSIYFQLVSEKNELARDFLRAWDRLLDVGRRFGSNRRRVTRSTGRICQSRGGSQQREDKQAFKNYSRRFVKCRFSLCKRRRVPP